MKKIYSLLFVILLMAACTPNQNTETMQSEPQKVLRHVVLFKFTDTSTPEEIKKVEDAFSALKGKISLIKDYEWGTNSSPENLNQGLTHCFFVTFHSDKDRDDYLVHPDHQAFVEVLKPHLDKVTVIDYWTK
jgi:Stress responsive A/B Barrel Domain